MDELGTDASNEPGETARAASRDGLIKVLDYSDTQLNDLVEAIDQVRFPINHLNLLREIARRAATSVAPPSASNLHRGRFTSHDELRGWVQSIRARSPIYGSGSIEVRPGEVIVNG